MMSVMCFKIMLIGVNLHQPDWEAGAGVVSVESLEFLSVEWGARHTVGTGEGKGYSHWDLLENKSSNIYLGTMTTDPEEKQMESGMGTLYKGPC